MTNAICSYDFTCWTETEHTKVITTLETYCKTWDFQQEIAPSTSGKHFQGRFSLKVKERLSGVTKKFPGWHLSPTLTEHIGTDYYVTKEDTRCDGPWSSKDEKVYIPRQVRGITLKPWQDQIARSGDIWDVRTINIIYDKKGNIGKTTLCTYMGCHKLGRKLPYCNDFRDMQRMVMDTPTSRVYLIDLPKAVRKEKLYQFYAGVEELKNGYAYDDRYKFREKYFDCPNIWIFSNRVPEREMFSNDRWVYWMVEKDELVEYTYDGILSEANSEFPVSSPVTSD